MEKLNPLSRRQFLGRSAVGAIGAATLPGIITSCSSQGDAKNALNQVEIPELLAAAPDGKPLKAGLIGCGGRGTGAATNFLAAGPNLQIVALGDLFADRLNACRQALKEKGQEIADNKCFLGFDAWHKVLDAGVDVVLLCTPPVFRPAHFEAAIKAGKHVFMEKPCAVDPVGARTILIASKKAEQSGLCVVSGTIRRSQKDCVETYRRVAGGAIGEIISAHVVRNGGALWHRKRQP
ncbi:MAG: Gfo/Idh/MocA family protein, partial [Bacteroidales bacterium]